MMPLSWAPARPFVSGSDHGRAGLDVALLERGAFPGEKNMFGGVLHRLTALEGFSPTSGNRHRWSGTSSRRISPS